MGLMSLSNDDGDGNENGKKAKQQLCTCALFCTFLFRQCTTYDVKMPNFTFCGEREHKTTTLQSLKISPQKKMAIFDELKDME